MVVGGLVAILLEMDFRGNLLCVLVSFYCNGHIAAVCFRCKMFRETAERLELYGLDLMYVFLRNKYSGSHIFLLTFSTHLR